MSRWRAARKYFNIPHRVVLWASPAYRLIAKRSALSKATSMNLPDFEPALPKLEPQTGGKWALSWNRSSEVSFLLQVINTDQRDTPLILVKNVDAQSKYEIKSYILPSISKTIIDFKNVSTFNDVWQIILNGYYLR